MQKKERKNNTAQIESVGTCVCEFRVLPPERHCAKKKRLVTLQNTFNNMQSHQRKWKNLETHPRPHRLTCCRRSKLSDTRKKTKQTKSCERLFLKPSSYVPTPTPTSAMSKASSKNYTNLRVNVGTWENRTVQKLSTEISQHYTTIITAQCCSSQRNKSLTLSIIWPGDFPSNGLLVWVHTRSIFR